MGRNRALVLATSVAASVLTASAAHAHPDYYGRPQVVKDPEERVWQLVLHYSDGILFVDPVSLIVRDANGATVVETEMAREICVWGCRGGSCLVFRYDLGLTPFPADVWRFDRGRLEPRDSPALRLLGVVVPLLNDPLDHLIMVVLFFAPFGLHVLVGRLPHPAARFFAHVGLWFGASFYLLFWAYSVALLGRTSPVRVLGLVGAFGVVWLAWPLARRAARAQSTGGPL